MVKKTWSGSFRGIIQVANVIGASTIKKTVTAEYYPGILGFTGIKLYYRDLDHPTWHDKSIYLGSSILTSLEYT